MQQLHLSSYIPRPLDCRSAVSSRVGQAAPCARSHAERVGGEQTCRRAPQHAAPQQRAKQARDVTEAFQTASKHPWLMVSWNQLRFRNCEISLVSLRAVIAPEAPSKKLSGPSTAFPHRVTGEFGHQQLRWLEEKSNVGENENTQGPETGLKESLHKENNCFRHTHVYRHCCMPTYGNHTNTLLPIHSCTQYFKEG